MAKRKRFKCPRTIAVVKRRDGRWRFKSPLTGRVYARRVAVEALEQARAAARAVEKRAERLGRRCSPQVTMRSGRIAFRAY